MGFFPRRYLLFTILAAAALLAGVGLIPRLEAERGNKNVAFIVEYKDITSLALQNGISVRDVWEKIHPLGVMGISVSEYTGEELALSDPLPLEYGPAASLGLNNKGILSDNASILIDKTSPYSELIYQYIKIKLPKAMRYEVGGSIAIVLPADTKEFKFSSIVPDFSALQFCLENDIPVLFRPGPCTPAGGKDVADALDFLAGHYRQIKNIIPSGMILPGYPDIAPLAKVLKQDGISLSKVEFVKQIGDTGFAMMMAPNVIPLHSLTRDEIISKNTSRRQMEERFVRAVHERSVRFVMMHPYDLQMGNRLEVFLEDLSGTRDALAARGYDFAWPQTMPDRPVPAAGALASALSLVFCLWFYCVRLSGIENDGVGLKETALLLACSFLMAGIIWKIPLAARLCGGFCGAFIATEAALTALECNKKPLLGALGGLFIIIAGGLSIASFYGTTLAALRLTPFSGVKLTLLLPPLLLVMHDLKRRIHPESIGDIIQRPALWGELMLVGLMMVALLIMALRSDNVSNVPAWEITFRDFIERLLLVRPRTKEFLIGYPSLVLYWYIVRKGCGAHYREVLRIAAVLAFCSAVNTFCHFHTLLSLSVIRVINGWWLGLLVGFVLVAVISLIPVPIMKKYGERY